MTHIAALPLFPLNTVLFPGQLLPLHIFEPRYRLMVEECLSARTAFGVVLIREGEEVGEQVTPFDVGTTARISQVERLPDGRMNIMSVGEARFKIKAFHHDRPFLTGDADMWNWQPFSAGEKDTRLAQLRRMLSHYMRMLARATGNAINLEDMPSEAESLASLAAIALQIPNTEKQGLLSRPDMGDLVDGCIDLLKRENRAMQITHDLPTSPEYLDLPFSLN